MKKSVIIIVSCVVAAILLSTFSIYAFMIDEQTLFSEEVKKLDLPDVSYSPSEIEDLSVPSQPPVEKVSKPWAIVKVASELPLLEPEPTKTVTLPHKTVTVTYYDKGYQEKVNTPPFYIYVSDDGDVFRFDAVGGELIYYEVDGDAAIYKDEDGIPPITLDEAQRIAEDFAGKHVDLSLYKQTGQVKQNKFFHFRYTRYVEDMPTQNMVNVFLTLSGKLQLYTANPHLFECVQIGDVDSEAIRQRFEDELCAKGQSLDYTLYCEIITLNDKGEPCVLYEYYYDRDDGRLIAIDGIEIPLTE